MIKVKGLRGIAKKQRSFIAKLVGMVFREVAIIRVFEVFAVRRRRG